MDDRKADRAKYGYATGLGVLVDILASKMVCEAG